LTKDLVLRFIDTCREAFELETTINLLRSLDIAAHPGSQSGTTPSLPLHSHDGEATLIMAVDEEIADVIAKKVRPGAQPSW
jgi:hypothetical protein